MHQQFVNAHRSGRLHLVRRAVPMVLLLASLSSLAASPLAAQDKGVNLSLQYRPGAKTTLIVLPTSGARGDSITAMLNRDLDYSDRFTMVLPSSAPPVNGPLNYPLFTKLGVDGVVQGTVLASGWLRVALHDVGLKSIKNSRDFPLPSPALSPAWRMAVHGVSDAIEEWITSQRGIAQTRIAFTRGGRIWTVDFDLANPTPVTPSGMSPQWVPSGRGIVYNVLDGSRDPLMFTDLVTGAQRTVAIAPGIAHITPSVSPDGKTVAFARVSESGTDLFAQSMDGGNTRRITVGRGRASSQPSFSPDGQRIVFMSDRSGHPEVYISDLDGTNVELLTASGYGDSDYRAGPEWSPDGRLVAFQSGKAGAGFQIMTINLRDQSVKQVTNEGRNDDPSWAPDSRHLVFTSTRSGVRQLWIADIETGRLRQLTFGPEARLAAWSPRLLSQ
jgi:TolB protein